MKKKKKVAKASGCPPGKMWHDKTNSCIDDPGYDITVTGRKISMREENYGPLNMLGVSSPVKQNGEIKDISELMENVEGYNPRTGYVMQGASGNLGLIGGIGKGIAKLFSWGKKKPFWPQTKNTGDLYAKARARAAETTAKPKSTGKPSSYEPPQEYSLPKITEGGNVLTKGDLMRRGITPGPYGGYYKKGPSGHKSFIHPWSGKI